MRQLPKRLALMLAAALALFSAGRGAEAADCCLERPARTALAAEVVADGLDHPWGMAFLPDGSILVTERSGALRRVADGAVSAPIAGLPPVADVGQGGLLDIALAPDFAASRLLFLAFAEPSQSGRAYGTAVARARLSADASRLEALRIIFRANIKSAGGRHFGARLNFAPDGALFVTLGDRGRQMRAQDPFDHAGSVVRIDREGRAPPDNPFADGKEALPEIWSIGHRNAQGAAIHPETGELWTLSHGAAGGDEVNIARAGRNYGWPLISYGSNYSGAPFERGAAAPGLEQPVYYWDPSIAPSGLAFYMPAKPLIPDWQGSLLAGALRGAHLSRLVLDGERVVAEERYLEDRFGRIRDVRTGPDGAVWLLTDDSDGQLIRVVQAGG